MTIEERFEEWERRCSEIAKEMQLEIDIIPTIDQTVAVEVLSKDTNEYYCAEGRLFLGYDT
jgi:hypothetical protein